MSTKEPFRTTFRVEPSGESWKATERDSTKDLWGRGKSPYQAVINYVRLVQEGHE